SRAVRARAARVPPRAPRAEPNRIAQQPRAAAETPGLPRGSPPRQSSSPTLDGSTRSGCPNPASRAVSPIHGNHCYVKSESGHSTQASPGLDEKVKGAGEACSQTVSSEGGQPIRFEEAHQEADGKIWVEGGTRGAHRW